MLTTLLFYASIASVQAHMSMFHPSVYGFDTPLQNPLGPGWAFDQWWFRGPAVRAAAPTTSFELQAGGTANIELACNRAWTSYGSAPTVPGSKYDGCNGDAGPYHADPAAAVVIPALVNGCALGIADKDNIEDVTPADIAIFTVNKNCITQKDTSFDIPANMPPCTGSKCICAWFWEPTTGTGNGYMTGFDCHVTGSPANAKKIATPQPPTWCNPTNPAANKTCVSGSKQPIYYYNSIMNPTTNPPGPEFNANRPGYVSAWSFEDGAQNDIFGDEKATGTSLPTSGNTTVSSSSLAGPASSPVTATPQAAAAAKAVATPVKAAAVAKESPAASPAAVVTPASAGSAGTKEETPDIVQKPGSHATGTPITKSHHKHHKHPKHHKTASAAHPGRFERRKRG